MIVATTSIASLMEDVQLTQAFNVRLQVNELQSGDDVQFLLREVKDNRFLGSEAKGTKEKDPKDNADMNFSEREISSIAGAITKPIGVKQLFMVSYSLSSRLLFFSDLLFSNIFLFISCTICRY